MYPPIIARVEPKGPPGPCESLALCERDALRLLQWHGGASSACYALASNSLRGYVSPAVVCLAAADELNACLSWVRSTIGPDNAAGLIAELSWLIGEIKRHF